MVLRIDRPVEGLMAGSLTRRRRYVFGRNLDGGGLILGAERMRRHPAEQNEDHEDGTW